MKLQIKILIAVLITTLAIGISLFGFFQEILINNAQHADEQMADQTTKHELTMLNIELSYLKRIVADCATRTETYNFVESNSTDYVQTDTRDITFQELSLNLMLFVNSSRQIVYGKSYNLQNQSETPLPSDLQRYLSPDSFLLKQNSADDGITGILLLDQKPMLVASHPILTSQRQGPSHGTLVVGRFLDSNLLASLIVMMNTQVIATPIQGNQSTLDMQSNSPSALENQSIYFRSLNSTALSTQMLLEDINGNPVLLIDTIIERTIFMHANNALFDAFLGIIIVEMASVIITLGIISKFVLSRLIILGDKMGKIENSGVTDERVDVRGNDEISELSNKFNAMLDRVLNQENAVKSSQAKYEALFMGSPTAQCYLNLDFCVLEVNPFFEQLFGYSNEEAKGKRIIELVASPNMLDKVESIMNEIKTSYMHMDSEWKRKDGSFVDAFVSGIPLIVNQNLAGYMLTFVDISAVRQAEKEITLMVEKLRVVGGLTRHDVRNKLSAVTGYTYLLKKKHSDQADMVEGLGKMEQAVKEIGKIFDFAKMYEQLGVEELAYVDVEKAVNEVVSLFSGFAIKVVNNCHGLTVLADSFLSQLFYNFVDNTKKYGMKTTAIRVYYEKAISGELCLIYEDDGVGVSAENKLKLFNEGFSTGGSTGFGLFLIKRMIYVYGWQIRETGESGKGAKFTITIPKLNMNGKLSFQIA